MPIRGQGRKRKIAHYCNSKMTEFRDFIEEKELINLPTLGNISLDSTL